MTLLRLNIGSGDKPLEGWDNIDRADGREAYPLDVADGTVDEIRASHVLEHFGHKDTGSVLADWWRALRPGGRIRIAVPDMDRIVDAYTQGKDWPITEYVMGGHQDANDRHGALFNRRMLVQTLREIGFAGFFAWDSELQDCASLPVSLNIGAYKVERTSWRPQSVCAALSHPRLAHAECMFAAISALGPLGIPLSRGGGVFWNQALQTMMENAIAAGTKYVLTLDYDAMFCSDDIVMLYDYMERNPDVSAVCPVQIGRDRDTALMTVADESGRMVSQIPVESLDDEALRIRSGHFACALIRVADLARLPKPWLCHKPDRNGSWVGEDRTDDDSHFWLLMRDAGMRVMQHNRVGIGHVQVVVTWPSRTLAPIHQYQATYNRAGKPKEALC